MARVYTQAQKITMHSKRLKIQIKSHLNIFRPRLQKAEHPTSETIFSV